MEPGINISDVRVRAVVDKAHTYGLSPDIGSEKGRHYIVTQVFLRDGMKIRSSSVPDHVFRAMQGVSSVQRVTPPLVSVAHGGNGDHHKIDIGGAMISTGLPCRLVFGPCTVDMHIDRIFESLRSRGVSRVRGGCWKPRSSPGSFPGLGEKAVRMLLRAAVKYDISAVFTEVIESEHVRIVERIKNEVNYHGKVVLWVGARTSNTILLKALGNQKKFPVMLKNSIDASGVDDLYSKAEWVLAGNMRWQRNGAVDAKRSIRSVNDQVILCLRGTRQTDPRSPWRFISNHHWSEIIQEQSWAPVAIDPSHSAGTLDKNLVMRNIKESLDYHPSLIMVEGGYPKVGFNGFRGLCDSAQSVPLETVSEVINLVKRHNCENYRVADTY